MFYYHTGLYIRPQSTSGADHIRPVQKFLQLVFQSLSVRRYDCFRQGCLKYFPVGFRRQYTYQSASHPVCRLRGKNRGACHALASGNHQHFSVSSFMCIVFSLRTEPSYVLSFISQIPCSFHAAAQIKSDIFHTDLSGAESSRIQNHPCLLVCKCHRQIRAKCRPQNLSVPRINSGRNVHRNLCGVQTVHLFQNSGIPALNRPAQSDSKYSIKYSRVALLRDLPPDSSSDRLENLNLCLCL